MGGINTLFSSEKIFDIWLGRRGPILFRALLDVFEIRVQYGTQITTSVGKSKTRNRNSSRKSVGVTYWESTGPVHMRPLVWLLVSFLLLLKKKKMSRSNLKKEGRIYCGLQLRRYCSPWRRRHGRRGESWHQQQWRSSSRKQRVGQEVVSSYKKLTLAPSHPFPSVRPHLLKALQSFRNRGSIKCMSRAYRVGGRGQTEGWGRTKGGAGDGNVSSVNRGFQR